MTSQGTCECLCEVHEEGSTHHVVTAIFSSHNSVSSTNYPVQIATSLSIVLPTAKPRGGHLEGHWLLWLEMLNLEVSRRLESFRSQASKTET